MTVYAVEVVRRAPGSSAELVHQLGTVTAAGCDLAKIAAARRWARAVRPGVTWLRVRKALTERETVPGRRSGHGGL